jgi:hypothetical protein
MPIASLDTVKTVTDITTSAVTILAIIIGAIWAYWRFARERTRWPRATLELVVVHRRLTTTHTLLNTKVKVHNGGSGLMKLSHMRVAIHQVLPVGSQTRREIEAGCLVPKGEYEAEWPCIGLHEREWTENLPEIEPQENDEFANDFLLAGDVQTVFIYAYIWNVKKKRGKRELGWPVTTFYDLGGPTGEGREDSLVARGVSVAEDRQKQQKPRPEPSRPERIEEGQQEPRPEPEKQPQSPPRNSSPSPTVPRRSAETILRPSALATKSFARL